VYVPITAVAFIQPDSDIARVQLFSAAVQLFGLIPPVPLSGVHVQLEMLQLAVAGVMAAVNVIELPGVTLDGAAVTLSWGIVI